MNTQSKTQNIDNVKPGDTVSHSNKQLMDAPEVKKVAEEVIEEENIDLGPATVGYILVYPNLSKKRAGKAKKASKEENYFGSVNYIIEISGELWDMLDSNTRKRLVHHYLLQLDPTFKAKNQEWKMKTRKPEYRDFYEINEKYGSDWYKTLQATASSLYDLSPKEEGKVRT